METWLSISPLHWNAIGSCMLAGTIIGFERQLLGKPVGIRTSMLVCLGTYVFVAVSNFVAVDATDPTRVIGQVVTGIGFLGAGVMMTRKGMVYGVTSAASIWMLAAIGVVVASGSVVSGIKLAVLTVVILVGVDWLESSFKAMRRGVHAHFGRRRDDLPPE